jgi:hypothetical protein
MLAFVCDECLNWSCVCDASIVNQKHLDLLIYFKTVNSQLSIELANYEIINNHFLHHIGFRSR